MKGFLSASTAVIACLFSFVLGANAAAFEPAFWGGADNVADATVIQNLGLSVETNLTNYTSEDEEIDPNKMGQGRSAWWTWTATETGFFDVYARQVSGGLTDVLLNWYRFENDELYHEFSTIDQGNPDTYRALSRLCLWAIKGKQYHFSVDPLARSDLRSGKVQLGLAKAKTITRSSCFGTGEYTTGYVSVTTTQKGSVSGFVILEGERFPIKGQIPESGSFIATLNRKIRRDGEKLPPALLQIEAYTAGWYFFIYTPDSASYISVGEQLFEKPISSPRNPHPKAGSYTAVIENGDTGFVYFSINEYGYATGVLVRSNATMVTFSALAFPRNFKGYHWIEFYNSLPNHRNGIVSQMGLLSDEFPANPGHTDVRGAIYDAAIDEPMFSEVYGGKYVPPFRNVRSTYPGASHMGFLENTIEELGQGLLWIRGGFQSANYVTYDPYGNIRFPWADNRPALKLHAATGLVTGAVDERYLNASKQERTRRRSLRGVMVEVYGPPTIEGIVIPLPGESAKQKSYFTVEQGR